MKITSNNATRSSLQKLLATAVATLMLSGPFAAANAQSDGYKLNPQAQDFIDALVKEENFDRQQLEAGLRRTRCR